MSKLSKTTLVLAALALIGLAVTLTPAIADDSEDRKEKVLANLLLKYPNLEQMNVRMNDITPSPYPGLDEGSFAHARGVQQFLISADDTKLWMVAEPVDVSRSADEIQAEMKKREEEESQAAMRTAEQLEKAISGLPMRGNPDAPITIVEFSDFQCPYCSRGANTMEEVLEKYPNDVKFVFKHFPLDFHKWAKPASIAAHCAGQQNDDAFWTLHDKYFELQKALTVENVVSKSKEALAGADLNMAVWETCAGDPSSEAYQAASAAVDADMALGQQLGVSGTPGFFVNGHFLNGAQPIAAFEPLIQKMKSQG